MTKAFLETMVLKPENEKFVLEAFSEKNLKKVREFDAKRVAKPQKAYDRKLSIDDLPILN